MLQALYICWQVIKACNGNPAKAEEIERKQRQYHIQEVIRQGKERAKRQQRTTTAPPPARKAQRQSASREWNQLVVMLQGDTATAKRLVDYEQARHPNQSEKWLVEKAIWRLERDRR